MKRLKISMFAVFAIVMGIAASAFTSRHTPTAKNGPQTVAWFQFMGDSSKLSQLQDNTEYTYTDGSQCSGSDLICSVQYSGTASSGQHPDAFSLSFKNRIATVYNGGTDSDISEEP